MPPCCVTEADLAGIDLLEQLQRLAAVLHQDVRGGSGALDVDVVEGLNRVPIDGGGAGGWAGATVETLLIVLHRCLRSCCR